VVLPAPLGPRKAKISPRRTSNDTSFTATTSPNFLTTLCSLMIGAPSGAGGELSDIAPQASGLRRWDERRRRAFLILLLLPHARWTSVVPLEGEPRHAAVEAALRDLDELRVAHPHAERPGVEGIVHAERDGGVITLELLAHREIRLSHSLEAAALDLHRRTIEGRRLDHHRLRDFAADVHPRH